MLRHRRADPWRDIAVGVPTLLIGALLGAVVANEGLLKLDMKISIAEVASLVVAISALVLAPRYLARFERHSAFDRSAVSKHLEPAREQVLAVEDRLRSLTSDQLQDADRADFVSTLRSMRTNIERSSRIAERWAWPKSFMEELQSAAGLAAQANRVVTGDRPHTRMADANATLRALHDLLLDLLRELA